MNKSKNIRRKSNRITKKNYPGGVEFEDTPNIGFVGNIVRKLPGTSYIIQGIKIKKINEAIRAATTDSLKYAINVLKSKVDLDQVNGEDHPMFNCIEFIIGRMPDHEAKALFDAIRARMTDYNKSFKGHSLLTHLFKKIVVDANDPMYKEYYVENINTIIFFKDLAEVVDLNRKDVRKSKDTLNILDYVLHPNYSMTIEERQKFLAILMNKNIQLECSNINALFSLALHTYTNSYDTFDLMNGIIQKGINVNVYRSDEYGDIIENYSSRVITETQDNQKIYYYHNTNITKFTPNNKEKNDVDLKKLEVGSTNTPVIYLLKRYQEIDTLIHSPITNINPKDKEKLILERSIEQCVETIMLMIPVMSEAHLLLMLKYIATHRLFNILRLLEPQKNSPYITFRVKLNSFKTYPETNEYIEMKTIFNTATQDITLNAQKKNPNPPAAGNKPVVPEVGKVVVLTEEQKKEARSANDKITNLQKQKDDATDSSKKDEFQTKIDKIRKEFFDKNSNINKTQQFWDQYPNLKNKNSNKNNKKKTK